MSLNAAERKSASSNIRVVHVRRDRYDVYVGRPHRFVAKTQWGPYGNPFDVKTFGLGEALRRYDEWLFQPAQSALRAKMRAELRGKVLACWCAPKGGIAAFSPDRICHAQTIAQVALSESDADLGAGG